MGIIAFLVSVSFRCQTGNWQHAGGRTRLLHAGESPALHTADCCQWAWIGAGQGEGVCPASLQRVGTCPTALH